MKKILYLILFLTLILFGCTFYPIKKVEFRDYVNNVYIGDVSSMLYRVGRPFPPHQEPKATYTEAFMVGDTEYTYQLGRLSTESTFKVEIDTTTRNIMTIIYKSREAGVDEVSALKIAICESSLDDQAKNPNSSAKGLYQIIDKTFKTYCKGDPLNAEDSTDCFIKLYPKHKSWWKCKG